ncbi:MAG: hypothetical protein RSC41_01285 [Oscillospiraceae bacterium]
MQEMLKVFKDWLNKLLHKEKTAITIEVKAVNSVTIITIQKD